MATPPLCCKLTLLAGATETLPEGTDVQLEGEGGGGLHTVKAFG